MQLVEILRRRYLDRLVASRPGRIHILNQCAEAESSDESAIFNLLLERVDDPQLHGMISKHKADEERHAEMFCARVIANGGTPSPVPGELRLIDRLDATLGSFFDRTIEGDRGVMEAYLLLQVIEERASSQFPIMADAFDRHDPDSAEVFRQIAADEERHLKYCRAISRRYAPDEETLRATLRRYRDIEAAAFADNGLANMGYTLKRGWVDVKPVESLLWRGFAEVGARRQRPQYTAFARAA